MNNESRQFSVGDRVHFHPIIGGKHDGKVYEISHIGDIPSREGVAWLKGKAGCVALEALSIVEEKPWAVIVQ